MKPRGRLENLASTVGDLAGAVRRRDRPDRIRLLDTEGRGRVLDADDPQAVRLVAAARALIDAADAPRVTPTEPDRSETDAAGTP